MNTLFGAYQIRWFSKVFIVYQADHLLVTQRVASRRNTMSSYQFTFEISAQFAEYKCVGGSEANSCQISVGILCQ
ncbi:hypothetical protein BSQ33_15930 [Vibrio gazogenes]|uniref:Uncharacterized protein n=1 Tax=Vibrio gazogenes TaxID=687 RepID=A0A1Z2SJC0_VIBGA|nr:hypothetical protein BSQ33_15930 [Vibrio gazogenes]